MVRLETEKDLIFNHYSIDKSNWNPQWAITVRPRFGYSETNGLLEDNTADFINRLAVANKAHILPIPYKGDERTGNRDHLHITLFVERGKNIHINTIAEIAPHHRIFKGDCLSKAIKPVTSYEGWENYKRRKHNPSYMWICCPRIREACKNNRGKRRDIPCAIMRGIVNRKRKNTI